ncbi:putative cytidine deaminase-like protein [Golovinomyces cichoracearum]|uniref:Putative cytidine deaminase-like protein n=1 Tax=Golovinomyces cichoracearum TaxID=62708 RepID=A0A420H6R7_9PEZI|nr:putative cytidine deaminase-like protein [Golovinomyces cichoracearum]
MSENYIDTLIPLKTRLEVTARDQVTDVWVVGLQVKMASRMLSLIRSNFPEDRSNLQHLRRFAKFKELPESVRTLYSKASNKDQQVQDLKSSNPSKLLKNPQNEHSTTTLSLTEYSNGAVSNSSDKFSLVDEQHLLLVVCPIDLISQESLVVMLSSVDATRSPIIFPTSVPLLAPTSSAQAKKWTESHWPTIYKKNNPFGPHPSIVSRAQAEIAPEVNKWMELAWRLARESSESNRGEFIGVVVVERKNGTGKVISTAGDARWLDWAGYRVGKGNPAAHAVMRAIAKVAVIVRHRDLEKREKSKTSYDSLQHQQYMSTLEQSRRITPLEPGFSLDKEEPFTEYNRNTQVTETVGEQDTDLLKSFSNENSCIFYENHVSETESQFDDPSANEIGYLCQDLEIYCTHEPCVMCSMAMVHSRFRRVVFEVRMPHTGGLTADGMLGYGLFWRKELNWTMLAWQRHIPTLATTPPNAEAASNRLEDPDLEA